MEMENKSENEVGKADTSQSIKRIAFITTPNFRQERLDELESFFYAHMYSLCLNFDVLTTGNTNNALRTLTERNFDKLTIESHKAICNDLKLNAQNVKIDCDGDLQHWRETILTQLETRTDFAVKGMIDVIYKVVRKKLDGLIHLTDWQDKSAKQDSAVLSREANVHNIPIATNVETAEAFIEQWMSEIYGIKTGLIYTIPTPTNSNVTINEGDLEKILDSSDPLKPKMLAMISHDGMKSDMDVFSVQYADQIFPNFNYVLATDSTGKRIKKLMKAMNRDNYADKIYCCKPGPEGGDLEIAYAVLKGCCNDIFFFQDPKVSQPHDADIRLFEQAVTSKGVHARFATNPASAELLIKYHTNRAMSAAKSQSSQNPVSPQSTTMPAINA